MYGEDLDPYAYGLMSTCADHIHWGGGDWTSSRGGLGAHDAAGGGHAHVGAMVYLGDNWPDEMRNSIFMCNLHGHRVNHDILEQKRLRLRRSSWQRFSLANDAWFRGIDLHYGPDGGVFVSDWTDTGECHNYDRVDLTNGRIYKITYTLLRRPAKRSGDARTSHRLPDKQARETPASEKRLVGAPCPAGAPGARRRPAKSNRRPCPRYFGDALNGQSGCNTKASRPLGVARHRGDC